jgi:hypothetical protein
MDSSWGANLVAFGVAFRDSFNQSPPSDVWWLLARALLEFEGPACVGGWRAVEDEDVVGAVLFDADDAGAFEIAFFVHRSPSSRCVCLLVKAGSLTLLAPVTNSRWLLWLSKDSRSAPGEAICSETGAYPCLDAPPMKAGAMVGMPGPFSSMGELKAEPAIKPSFDLRPSKEYGEAVLSRIDLSSFGDGITPWRE